MITDNMYTLGQKYLEVRKRSLDLCVPLQTEDYVPQVVEFASPPKWHLAHITWFFEELILKKYVNDYTAFDPDFCFLFNSYYNTVGERTIRAQRGNITRPGVDEIYAYRVHVDKHISELLKGDISKELYDVVTLGLNHEQQHQELLMTDMKYMFAHNPTFPVYSDVSNLLKDKNREEGWVEMNEGIYEIGHNSDEFCYDNEFGRHRVFLENYSVSKKLVTNGEYMEFMQQGGYNSFQFWLDEGWSWVQENAVQSPLYWHKIKGVWHYYTLAGLTKVDPDALLSHVSFYEANAYAAWKGLRLPTEFEWEAASDQFDWGKRWEWTNSAYLPYPDFSIAEGAVGEYNGKFMVNQMVLRGASVVTAPNHSRKTYRNFFHPHFQWQYSGIRLAK